MEKNKNASLLPVESKHYSAVPNDLLRCCLFGIFPSNQATFVHKKVIFTQGKRKITYTGMELNQPHLDLWTIIKKGYIDQGRDHAVFRSKEVLQAIGVADGGTNRKVLRRNLENLKGAEITVIREDGSSIIFNLLNSVAWKDQYSNFAISLDLRILNMFDNSNYSYLDLILRQKLKSDLARWLYSFYRSHKKPFPMLAKTYMDLCGSKGKSLPKFKERLKKAHDELVDIKFLRIYLSRPKNPSL